MGAITDWLAGLSGPVVIAVVVLAVVGVWAWRRHEREG
jgi:hypothetical protein